MLEHVEQQNEVCTELERVESAHETDPRARDGAVRWDAVCHFLRQVDVDGNCLFDAEATTKLSHEITVTATDIQHPLPGQPRAPNDSVDGVDPGCLPGMAGSRL